MTEAALSRRLEGKVVLITGSGRGIGRCQALSKAREGASIIVNDIGLDNGLPRADTVAAEVRARGGRAIANRDDVSTVQGAARALSTAADAFEGLDILVNNAGLRAAAAVDGLTERDWDLVLDSHLKATFLTIKFAVPMFRRRGRGLIINTGSEAGLGMPFNAAYAAAKEGIAGLTRSVARELGRELIRCNLILPRASLGTGGSKFGEERFAEFLPAIKALGRYGMGNRGHTLRANTPSHPEHVAEFVTWLCTEEAAEINGSAFYVGGDEIGLFTEPEMLRSIVRPGSWSAEEMSESCRELTADLHDRFRLEVPD